MAHKQNRVMPTTSAKVIEALVKTGGYQAQAAGLLGISVRRFQTIIKAMRDSGEQVPSSPHDMSAHYRADQASIHGTSTLLDAEGNVRAQWVKERAGVLSPEQFAKVAKIALAGVLPTAKITAPAKVVKDLLAVYPMGDPHIGMYAWSEETGQDFDLDIAERHLVAATRHLASCCPAAENALIANVGDFFHADNVQNRTLRGGNVLDVDTRWAKVLRVGLRTMRACIEAALVKHKHVTVINEIGNHDEHSSQMLTIALAQFYEDNPRVTFDESPARFHYYRFGKNLVGVTHGDTVKPEKLGGVMSVDRAADWGETLHRYWYTGHIHHKKLIEEPGYTAESFRTLAARDAWSAGMGFRSGRDMQAIVLDKDHGEVQRHRIDISMLEKMFK